MSLMSTNAVWAAGMQSFFQSQPNVKIMGFVAETGSFMQPESSTATVSSSNTGSGGVTFNGSPGYTISATGESLIPVLSPDANMQLFAVVEETGGSDTTPTSSMAAGSYNNATSNYTATAESWISELESMVGFQAQSNAQNVPAPGTNDIAMLLGSSPLIA